MKRKYILLHRITLNHRLQGGLKHILPIASVQPWRAKLRLCPYPLPVPEVPSATLAGPIAVPPFPVLPLPLVLPDAPLAVAPFIAIPNSTGH
ncbi:MAG TPA: hypothetical protein VEP90_03480 [Methylomirabilota bacterium]|nr:hypothetical protein [Methylomirabilota bacterium]